MKLKVVPEPSERWATTIGGGGQRQRGIERLDRRIVPRGDGAHEDAGERLAVEHEVARLDAVDVDDRHDAAHHHRELHEAVLGEVVVGERLVGGAEGHGLGFDLLDAAARTDRLVVEAGAGRGLVGVRPLGEHGIDEGRAGAGDVGGEGRRRSWRGRTATAATPLRIACFMMVSLSREIGAVPPRRRPDGPAACARHPRAAASGFMSVRATCYVTG